MSAESYYCCSSWNGFESNSPVKKVLSTLFSAVSAIKTGLDFSASKNGNNPHSGMNANKRVTCFVENMSYIEVANLYDSFCAFQYGDQERGQAWSKFFPEIQECLKKKFEQEYGDRASPVAKLYNAASCSFPDYKYNAANPPKLLGSVPISPTKQNKKINNVQNKLEKIQKSSYQKIVQLNENEILFSQEDVVQDCRSEWGKRISRRRRAIKYVLDHEKEFLKKRFSISQETVQFLRQQGFDEAEYQECQGNELQQVVHQEFLEIVLDTADLSQEEKQESVEQFQKLILSCSHDGCGLNQQGKVLDAMRISDFCQSALDAGSTVLKARFIKTDGKLHTLELEASCENALKITEALDKTLFSQKSLEHFAALQSEQFLNSEDSEIEEHWQFNDFVGSLKMRTELAFAQQKEADARQRWPEKVAQRLEHENEFLETRQQVMQRQMQKELSQVLEIHEGLLVALAEDDLPLWYDRELWNERAQNYEQALQNVNTENSFCEIKLFTFSDQFKNFLIAQGADVSTFALCEGNNVQQVLHQGFIDDIDFVSELDTKNLDRDERELVYALQALTVSYAQCGYLHNKAGDIQNAWALSQVCGVLRDYAKAIAFGVCDGVKDVADIFLHPVDTVCTLGHVLWFTTSNTASFLCDCTSLIDGILLADQKKYQKALARIEVKVDAVKKTLDNVWTTIQNSPGEDRARFIARMATGVVLQKPSFRLAGKIFTNAKTAAKNLLHSKPMVQFANGARITVRAAKQAGRNIVAGGRQAVDAARRAMLPPLARARLALKTVTKKACEPCKNLVEEGRCIFEHGCSRCRDAAISSERALARVLRRCHPRFAQLVKNGYEMKGMKVVLERIKLGLSETEFMRLRRFFGTTVETTGRLGNVEIPRQFILEESFWRHIFTGELEVLMESAGNIINSLSGFHHDFRWKNICGGLLKLKNKTYDRAKQIMMAEVIDGGGLMKSFFPKNWSSKKVAGKITEALKNLKNVRVEGERFIFSGYTSEGIKIEIVTSSSGRLITAYPIF